MFATFCVGAASPTLLTVQVADVDVCMSQAWESDVESTIVSKLHSEVSQVMGSLGVSHNIERITDDGLFSADILIEDDKVIVEVDGPHHFTVNTHQPLGEFYIARLAVS